jgi:hypothetical protein
LVWLIGAYSRSGLKSKTLYEGYLRTDRWQFPRFVLWFFMRTLYISKIKKVAALAAFAGGTILLGLSPSFAQGTGGTSGTGGAGDTSSSASSPSSSSSDTGTTSSNRGDSGFNMGWIGLLGLAGLYGLKKHHEGYDTHGATRTA